MRCCCAHANPTQFLSLEGFLLMVKKRPLFLPGGLPSFPPDSQTQIPSHDNLHYSCHSPTFFPAGQFLGIDVPRTSSSLWTMILVEDGGATAVRRQLLLAACEEVDDAQLLTEHHGCTVSELTGCENPANARQLAMLWYSLTLILWTLFC